MPAQQRRRRKVRLLAKVKRDGIKQRLKHGALPKLRSEKKSSRENDESDLVAIEKGATSSFYDEDDDNKDERIYQLLRGRKATKSKKDIYLTDIFDVDEDKQRDEEDKEEEEEELEEEEEEEEGGRDMSKKEVKAHEDMIKKVFEQVNDNISSDKTVTVVGGHEAIHTPSAFDINTNVDKSIDLKTKDSLSGIMNEDSTKLQGTRHQSFVSMKEMLSRVSVPIDNVITKQIQEVDDFQDTHRMKLLIQQKINPFDIARKERGLQMHRTTQAMSEWDGAIDARQAQLKNETNRTFVAPQTTLNSFVNSMQWTGDLGKELQGILNDYETKHDLVHLSSKDDRQSTIATDDNATAAANTNLNSS
ncbi:hypothetical protein RFI_12069, partial [Reticulomyxa filosa]